ncbi:MAG: FKBP-type peptidyl-prolyl cis-trans isomerase [Muribaculaceae bacterium]|nr:FKBP-type peptidyl-prolyl cis-trans isomerase [Muribaculaceae bacterium]
MRAVAPAIAGILFFHMSAMAQSDSTATGAAMDSEAMSRAIGTVLGNAVKGSMNQLQGMGATFDRAVVLRTVERVVNDLPTGYDLESANRYIETYLIDRRTAGVVDTVSAESQQEFLARAASDPGAQVLPSGVVLQIIQEGEGEMPKPTDTVRLMYVGRLSDGEVFDNADTPVEFELEHLVPGFTQGVILMRPGGTYRLTIPAEMAYGDRGIPGAIPAGAALQFDITLLSVVNK